VRLDNVLERQMALHGDRISHVGIAVFIDNSVYEAYGGSSLNDDFLAYLCLIATNEDRFTLLSPVTHKPIDCLCYSYSNINGEKLKDSRKKVVRYIVAANHSIFKKHPKKTKCVG
jgi:hypothetical protein